MSLKSLFLIACVLVIPGMCRAQGMQQQGNQTGPTGVLQTDGRQVQAQGNATCSACFPPPPCQNIPGATPVLAPDCGARWSIGQAQPSGSQPLPSPAQAGGGGAGCGPAPCPSPKSAAIVPSDRGGFIVFYDGTLYKYDKDLNLVKKVRTGD